MENVNHIFQSGLPETFQSSLSGILRKPAGVGPKKTRMQLFKTDYRAVREENSSKSQLSVFKTEKNRYDNNRTDNIKKLHPERFVLEIPDVYRISQEVQLCGQVWDMMSTNW